MSQAADCLLCVDAGTTTTRVWLLAGDRVVARQEGTFGARDTARDGHDRALRQGLQGLLAWALGVVPAGSPAPRRVAAAGMITSPQGLAAIPHVAAPASLSALAAAAQERLLPDVCALPFVFVPGVRTDAIPGLGGGVGATDVMRGEETLCLGLLRQGRLAPAGALLNVGSHWKLIGIDGEGRVAWSRTSLAGEMVHAVRTSTILASGLPTGRVVRCDVPRVEEGMAEARRSGLARALFCVRLLELGGASPEERLSFLLGAFIGAELQGLSAQGLVAPGASIAVAGDDTVGGAWSSALQEAGYAVRSLARDEVEAAFVAGLRAVIEERSRSSA